MKMLRFKEPALNTIKEHSSINARAFQSLCVLQPSKPRSFHEFPDEKIYDDDFMYANNHILFMLENEGNIIRSSCIDTLYACTKCLSE